MVKYLNKNGIEALPMIAGAMEPKAIQKNGVSPKNLRSRGNFKMNRLFHFLIMIGIIAMGTIACEKDVSSKKGNDSGGDGDDPGGGGGGSSFVIEAKGVIGDDDSDVVSVGAIVEGHDYDYEAGTAKYGKNGFKITLTSTVSNKYLTEVDDVIDEDVVSDKKAKISYPIWIDAYDEDDECIGEFYCYGDEWEIWYLYADRSFTAKGNIYSEEYDCSFKKGWNILYYYDNGSVEKFSTKKPSGINFKWYYVDDYSWKTPAHKKQNFKSRSSKHSNNKMRTT